MFSPIDEAAHYDYVDWAASGHLPKLGDFLLPSTLRTISCVGIALHGLVTPPCNVSVLNPLNYPGGGYQYEAQQPPLYYAVTAALRWVPAHLASLSQLDATRLAGIIWLACGLLLLWGAGRLLGLTVSRVSLGVLLLAAAPVVLYETSIVSDEASAIFAGALVTFMGALAWQHRSRWMVPALCIVGFLVCLMAEINVFAVTVVAVLFLLLGFSDRRALEESSELASWRSPSWYWIRRAVALLFGGGLAIVLWLVAFRARSLINPVDLASLNVQRVGPMGVSKLGDEALSLLTPLTNSYDAYRSSAAGTTAESFLSQNLQVAISTVLTFVVLGGALSGLFVRPRQWSHWVGLVALPVLYVGGFAFGFSSWLTYNADPGLVSRYGLAVAPLLILGLVASLRGRFWVGALWLFAVASFGLSFYFMLAA
jgi:hypothetical protein